MHFSFNFNIFFKMEYIAISSKDQFMVEKIFVAFPKDKFFYVFRHFILCVLFFFEITTSECFHLSFSKM